MMVELDGRLRGLESDFYFHDRYAGKPVYDRSDNGGKLHAHEFAKLLLRNPKAFECRVAVEDGKPRGWVWSCDELGKFWCSGFQWLILHSLWEYRMRQL